MGNLPAAVQLHQGVEVDLATFIGNAEPVRLGFGRSIVRAERSNDTDTALQTRVATFLNRYALEQRVRIWVAVERVGKGIGIAQDRRCIIDPRLGQSPGLGG